MDIRFGDGVYMATCVWHVPEDDDDDDKMKQPVYRPIGANHMQISSW
jgi:hypothetical protein